MAAAVSSPPMSPNYRGVGTLLKHWGTSEITPVDDKQMKICEDSGLDSLLHLAKMPHVKVQGLAMSVINSLREGDNGDIQIDSEEGFRPLVDLAKFAEEDVQREAVWSLAILASNSSCQVRIEQEVGWHNFRKYAASTVPEIQAGTAILLGNLALEKKNEENIMVKGVPLLLNMLAETKDPKVRRAVVTALSNVSIIENYGAKDVWLEKGIELMMPYIEQSDDMQLLIGALNTIANVCNHDRATDLKKKVAQLDGVSRLVPLLDSQDEMVVKLAAMTMANMASDEGHRMIMHDLGVEVPLVRLLDSRDEEVQLGVSMAINALADHDSACKDFRSRNAAEPLKELIQLSKDRDILKEARDALRKISPEDYNAIRATLRNSYSSSYSGSEDSESESYTRSAYESENDRSKRSRTNTISDSMSDSGSEDSDSDDSDSALDNRGGGSSFLMRQQHEAKRVEEERKFREEQERRRKEEEDEIARKRAGDDTLSDSRLLLGASIDSRMRSMSSDSIDSESGSRRSLNLNLTEEEVRLKRSEAGRRKEKDDDITLRENATNGVPLTEEEVKKEEELRLKRMEGNRIIRDESSSSISGAEEAEPAPVTEEERRRREEVARKKEEDDKVEAEKKAEELRLRREESERIRKIEEEEFHRREEVEKNNREELENSDTSSVISKGSRRRKRRDGSVSATHSLRESVNMPKHPAKALVMLLKDAKHKKMIERDALRELERYAHRKERDQVQHGEDIIAILVYIIYFYPDADYTDIVILALYILALLARYSVRNQHAIRRARGGEQIITLLQSGIEGVRRNAALALGAYTLNNKSIQSEVTKSIRILSLMLENQQTPPSTRRTLGACLAAIADNHNPNQVQVIASGALRATINMLPVDKLFVRSGLHLVAASVSHNISAQNQVLLDFPRFLSDLLAMLNAPDMVEFQDCAVNTLVELSKKNTRVQQGIYHAEGIPILVPLLNGFQSEEDMKKMQLVVNVLYLLLTQIKLPKYSKKVREELVRLRVVALIQPMCAAKSRLLAETALNLTKAIEART